MKRVHIILTLLLLSQVLLSQNFRVDKVRDLDFGSFSAGSGGTISIASNRDVRSATGDVILMGSSYGCAVYHITTTSTTPITLQIGRPTVEITGPNGGKAILEYTEAHPELPVVVAGSPVVVRIGGTLHVGPQFTNPSGTYSGTALINFNLHND